MVEFDLVAALVAGVVATVVMSAMMAMAASAGMTDMPTMPLISGAMVTGDRSAANRIGSVMHYLVMGTVAFGIAYVKGTSSPIRRLTCADVASPDHAVRDRQEDLVET